MTELDAVVRLRINDPATITISRKANAVGDSIPLTILLDGCIAGKLEGSDSISLMVSCGKHRVCVTTPAWNNSTHSDTILVDSSTNNDLQLVCGFKRLNSIFLRIE